MHYFVSADLLLPYRFWPLDNCILFSGARLDLCKSTHNKYMSHLLVAVDAVAPGVVDVVTLNGDDRAVVANASVFIGDTVKATARAKTERKPFRRTKEGESVINIVRLIVRK